MKTPYFAVILALGCGCAKSGIDEGDIAKLDVHGTPAEVAPRIPKADAKGTRIFAHFKKDDFFDELQLDWNGSLGRAAPQWIALEASKETPIEERSRLGEVLHGGLLPGDAWIYGPIRIALKQNGSLEGTVDPKPGNADNPLFEKQSSIMMRVFAHAAFGAPLGVSADDMRDAFGGGYPLASLDKIDPTTATSGAAAHVTSIFPGASVNASHIEIAVDHPVALFARLDWDDAPNGKLKKVLFTESWNADRKAFDACLKKATLAGGATLQVAGSVATASAPESFTKEAWSSVVAAVDGCR